LIVQKLEFNLSTFLRGVEVLRFFWLVDTSGEKVSPHKMSFNIVSSLAFLIPLLESPLVIVFPYLLSQIF